MNKAVSIAKKNELYSLIKTVGLRYGEELDSLREYAKEVFENHDIDKAIACFRDLAEITKYMKTLVKN
jgi:hypothetical protein